MKLGFLGTGAMTSAIVTGLGSAKLEAQSIWLSPRNSVRAGDLASRFENVSVASSNQEVLDRCETVVLAVRPQIARKALSELRFRANHHVISIMSTISLRTLSELVAPARRIARAVPLPSAARNRSPTAICPRDTVAVNLFAALGTAFEVDEELEFDALCAATATIASYFAFAQSIATWLERQGIRQAEAREYMARIFFGVAAAALEAPGLSFESLAADYATRGGINEQVLIHLARRGLFDTIAEGLDAVMLRMAEASRQG
jgi:pyrroline-5-carboxylate reductase